MSVGIHTVVADSGSAAPRFNNVDSQLVQANSSAEATALAQAIRDDDIDPVWAEAVVTYIPDVPVLENWVFRVQVSSSVADVSVTGDSNDTLDAVMAKIVIALNATALDGAAYNSSTNLLDVSSIADGVGDKAVTVTVTPPSDLFPDSYTWDQADVVGTVTDEGMAAAKLTVQFSTTWVVPGRVIGYKQS